MCLQTFVPSFFRHCLESSNLIPSTSNVIAVLIPAHADTNRASGNEWQEQREDSQSLLNPNAGARSECFLDFESPLQRKEQNPEKK